MRLVVALGNPGKEYQQTRHNIGWMVFEKLKALQSAVWKEKFDGVYTELSIDSDRIFFLMPMTYMNLSGKSVAKLAQFFKVNIEDILVIHDELDLNFGTIAFKSDGGTAGHNGLKSMVQELSTDKFKRLRVGIGRPKFGDVSSHVLSKFNDEEGISLDKVLDVCVEALNCYLKNGFSKAASEYSRKKII